MRRHGITVLSLLLLVIAIIIVGVFLLRYLRASGA
jgi:flagellar biogenesis protein FliO